MGQSLQQSDLKHTHASTKKQKHSSKIIIMEPTKKKSDVLPPLRWSTSSAKIKLS